MSHNRQHQRRVAIMHGLGSRLKLLNAVLPEGEPGLSAEMRMLMCAIDWIVEMQDELVVAYDEMYAMQKKVTIP